MIELEEYIKSYFGIVQQEDVKVIVSLFTPEVIKKNQLIVATGKRCHKLSFVQSGMLRVFASTEAKEVTQWISTKGYFTTDLASFIFNTPSRWTIQALVDTAVFSITKENYKKITQLVSQWPTLEKLFLVRCFTLLEDRIFSHLSMSAEERYQLCFQENPALFNQVPLQYIASMLGMTPETFSRIRKKQLSLHS